MSTANMTEPDNANAQNSSLEGGVSDSESGGGSKAHIGNVVLVVAFIASILIAIGFFVYNAQDEPPAQQNTTTTHTNTDELDTTSPLSAQAIDSETQQIDQTVEDLDNNKDFNDEELSESSLGY